MELNKYIDHTLLKADATTAMVQKICDEALQYQFASVCVNSGFASVVTTSLQGSTVKTCCVVGFPLGAMDTTAKVYETEVACRHGASEIDMVINIGLLKEGRLEAVKNDMVAVVEMAHQHKALVKVIIETALLTDDEKKIACELAVSAKADFVKTSTGFSTGGATLPDVKLMKEVVGERCKVKASGGVKNREQAVAFIKAGADRLGTSNGVAIMQGSEAGGLY